MKNKFAVTILLLILNFGFITSIFSDDIKIQRVLNIGEELNCITQDKDELFWITVRGGGLFYYDGRELKKALFAGSSKNPSPIIWSVFVDSGGLIWFLISDYALCSYDKKNGICKEYKPEVGNTNSLTSSKVNWLPNTITEDREGLIWIGTADGLNAYDKKTDKFTQYKHILNNPNSLSNNSVWTVFADRKGVIWIGTEDGLDCYDKSSGKFHHYKNDPHNSNSISDNHIRAIAEDKEGNLWIGTKNTGVDKFDKKTSNFTNYRYSPNDKNCLSYNEIHHIMIDKDNNLWICNEGGNGIDQFNSNTNIFKHYSNDPRDSNSIGSNIVLCSFEDKTGIILLVDAAGNITKCTMGKGVVKNYQHDPENPTSLSINDIMRIHQDKSETIWMATFNGGLCSYKNDGKFESFKFIENSASSLPSNLLFSVLDASGEKLWLGLYSDLICLFDPVKKQVVRSFKNPYQIMPCFLTQDNKNSEILWFASFFSSGLFKLNTVTGKFSQYKHNSDANSIGNKNTNNIFQDENLLWLGTGGDGLCKFDKTTGKCEYYKHDPNDKNSISGDVVIEPFIDSKGSFWVTTDDGGLNKFNRQTGSFTSYGMECGFPSKCTRHILEDKKGYLWISTNSGIVKFDPTKSKVVKRFTTADGLADNRFDRMANALKDSQGNFWFSTLKGLCKFNPEEASKIEPNKHIPSIVLSSFKSKEGTYNEDGLKKLIEIKLPWSDNSFSFTFAALDYMDPEKNQYAYKLEGFDKDWNFIGTNHFGQYSNLNPGEYILRLKGSNNDGIWNKEGISIKITITPPFWMTSWFKGLIGIAVLCTIGGVFQLRTTSLKKKAIYMRDHAIAKTTAQVTHDIRSPLAALNTALRDLKELPEQKRILIRNATHRISDIANNLLVKYKMKGKEDSKEQKDVEPELVSSLLDHLISEKRVQLTEKSIELILELDSNTYSYFVKLDPEIFKRTISNLINNAIEAIETTKGVIRVILTKQDNDLIIKIIDNGKGIPEDILLKTKQGKISSTKKEGCGLGISSAIQNIRNWGGNYDIQSKVGEGTTFTVTLPVTEAPDWFQDNIILSSNTHIIVLDDDESIHNIWQAHFREHLGKKLVTLDHFYESSNFSKYCKTSRSENDLFLVDYELINSKETGLDLIEQLDLKDQAILVTSRYEEPEIRERIKRPGIKIIPKSFAPYIPISVVNNLVQKQPELIFIDNDKTLTEAWNLQASLVKKKIAAFNCSEDFKKVMSCYNKDISIYVDSDLNEQISGEMFAKFLYEQGFQNLYLSTGYEKDRFDYMPWIKNIVAKEPPF